MVEIISNKLNPQVIPHLDIWRWEVPVYLFFGGLAAGLLILASGMLLLQKGGVFSNQQREPYSYSVKAGSLLAPVLLGIGMFFLFLDLAYKVHVWRFYTAFVYTSPMSWGSWVLILFFPLSAAQAMVVNRDWFENISLFKWIIVFTEKNLNKVAMINVHVGAAVGVYTGILLSTFYARPVWSSSILGFVFLLSGLSAAAALIMILAPHNEKLRFSKMDMYLISLEGFATTLFIVGGITGSENVREAMLFLITGHYAPWFWIVFVFGGMVIPLFLETLESLGKSRFSPIVPVLVLLGSITLRFVIVFAGQEFQTFA